MNKTILLIDDDEDELEIFQGALKQVPFPMQCVQALGAEEGLKMLDTVQPDYIFVDYNMPRENGLACLQALRQRDGLENIPIVLYSNYIDAEMEKKALKLGATLCMKKPFMTGILARKLKELFNGELSPGKNR
ncbi:MAG TPA: response regulator [Chitinophagaceae bacterium]|nr:response regulator [Chitinophagaceae bacterium]